MPEHELTLTRRGWWRRWTAGCSCSRWIGCAEHTRRRAVAHHTVHAAVLGHIFL